jgi:hypothetical protein
MKNIILDILKLQSQKHLHHINNIIKLFINSKSIPNNQSQDILTLCYYFSKNKIIKLSPTMGSKWNGPILSVVLTTTHNPSRLRTNAIDFWAWASWKLVSRCRSTTRAGRVAARSDNRSSFSRRVPVSPRWKPLLKWAFSPNLSLRRFSWSHVARPTWARWSLMPTVTWACIVKLLAH